jgi:hypothetical protein
MRYLHSIKSGKSRYFIDGKRVSYHTYEARLLIGKWRGLQQSCFHTLRVGRFNKNHTQHRFILS